MCFLIDGSVPLLKSQSQRFVIFKVNGEVSCIKVRVSKGFFESDRKVKILIVSVNKGVLLLKGWFFAFWLSEVFGSRHSLSRGVHFSRLRF